ncbi:MAG: cytochrome c maturation protein CcmE [Ignavibacteria bacterium]|nr:cytochrome c maturation protein CcmE [Ignavibacteria bacterium]
MSKQARIIVGVIIVVVFLVVGFMSFMDSKIEYVNFKEAESRQRTVEVKGQWIKDKGEKFDVGTNQFTFYMKDDFANEMKVVFDGAKPNNFEVAEAVVVKGKVKDGYFHAKDILTKCPSKYEANGSDVKGNEEKKPDIKN